MRYMMSMMVTVTGLRMRPRRSCGGAHDGAEGASGDNWLPSKRYLMSLTGSRAKIARSSTYAARAQAGRNSKSAPRCVSSWALLAEQCCLLVMNSAS